VRLNFFLILNFIYLLTLLLYSNKYKNNNKSGTTNRDASNRHLSLPTRGFIMKLETPANISEHKIINLTTIVMEMTLRISKQVSLVIFPLTIMHLAQTLSL